MTNSPTPNPPNAGAEPSAIDAIGKLVGLLASVGFFVFLIWFIASDQGANVTGERRALLYAAFIVLGGPIPYFFVSAISKVTLKTAVGVVTIGGGYAIAIAAVVVATSLPQERVWRVICFEVLATEGKLLQDVPQGRIYQIRPRGDTEFYSIICEFPAGQREISARFSYPNPVAPDLDHTEVSLCIERQGRCFETMSFRDSSDQPKVEALRATMEAEAPTACESTPSPPLASVLGEGPELLHARDVGETMRPRPRPGRGVATPDAYGPARGDADTAQAAPGSGPMALFVKVMRDAQAGKACGKDFVQLVNLAKEEPPKESQALLAEIGAKYLVLRTSNPEWLPPRPGEPGADADTKALWGAAAEAHKNYYQLEVAKLAAALQFRGLQAPSHASVEFKSIDAASRGPAGPWYDFERALADWHRFANRFAKSVAQFRGAAQIAQAPPQRTDILRSRIYAFKLAPDGGAEGVPYTGRATGGEIYLCRIATTQHFLLCGKVSWEGVRRVFDSPSLAELASRAKALNCTVFLSRPGSKQVGVLRAEG